uniref:Alanine--tRNA ligase n=1 Tax=Pygocentrus nattereri TaxID=42514 RepID=A0AAR2L449_PYGNA
MAACVRALRGCARLPVSASSRRCSALSRARGQYTSQKVRRTFIEFFTEQHRHRAVPSAPVRPRGDPSLLFVNAGMNQFKPILLGCADPRSEMASYQRVVNSQKCVRAGGKHNDLDDVGRDVYHHTFFEMLGNWSFGDYFKVEACAMAWHLLTEVYEIPAERLYVSYFSGDAASGLPADEETRHIWLSLGLRPDHVLPFGMKDNFWEMGETGPCGPCTEIHYDHVGTRNAAALVNADSPDVVEIWNLVFMQYNREGDGGLRALPQCSVDTGMGLERLLTVLQGKRSNYDTDLFTPLLSAIHQCSRAPAYSGRTEQTDAGRVDMAYRVVADHVRTLSVCIADGVYPGMTGAELVLRRILRRAVRFSTEVLHAPEGALASLVPTVAHILVSGVSVPQSSHPVQFTVATRWLLAICFKLYCWSRSTAAVAWSLHRNLGFPLDLIDLMLEERNMAVDKHGVEQLAAEQEQLHRSLKGGAEERGLHMDLQSLAELQSRGVPHTNDSPKYSYSLQHNGTYVFSPCRASVLALYCNQSLVSEVSEGQRCGMVLDQTCFYAEQGGQMHDQGYFTKDGLQTYVFQDVLFPVECVRLAGGYVVHEITAAETLRTGDQIQLHVDEASLNVSQLQEVERMVQDIIHQNDVVHMQEVPLARANQIAGLRTVDEVYPDPVRVVSVGVAASELLSNQKHKHTSVELCCGTHLLQTGGIGDFVIVSERQMVKGISRIIAVTGEDAKQAREAGQVLLQEVEALTARIATDHTPSLATAQRLSKEVGLLTDAVESTPIPQWQRRDLQTRLKALQRSSNTTIRKLEMKEVRT